METLIHAGLMNAFFAAILAVIVAGLAVLCRGRPAVVHALWVLVLVKFLVPSVYPVEIPWWRPSSAQLDSPEPVVGQEIPARPILADQNPDRTEDLSSEPMLNEQQVRAATDMERTAKPLPIGRGSASGEILPPASENLALASTDPPISPDLSTAAVPLSWEQLVGMLWLTGSLAWMAVAGFRIVRFHRILRLAKPAQPEVQIRVRKLAERLGLSVCPSVAFVSAPIAPLLWALTRWPRLLIPSQLWERLNEEQRDTLLVHELAHLRRGDHWVRRLEMLVLALYWWHPAVWWAQRQLREAEEQCCDAWVLWALPNSGHHYAVALVETLAFLCHSRPALPLGASGIEPMRLLKRRLSMIVQGHTPRGMSRLAFWSIVVLGLLLLPLLPVPAQQTGGPASDDEEQVQPPAPPRTPPTSPEAPSLQPPPAEGPPIRVGRAEQIEAARDEVELMKAKLMIRRAEIEETKTKIRLAQRNMSRLEDAYKKGTVPESMLENARTEAELLPSQLSTKQAQIQEAEILLKQAERRLRRLESGQTTQEAPLLPPPMKGPGGLSPAKSGSGRMIGGPGGPSGKALPGATPGAGMPGKMGPSLPGPGGPMKAPPGSPAGPGTGKAPPAGSTLPPGPGGGPSANPPSDDAQGVVLNVDANTGLATISVGGDPLPVGAGSRFEAYRLKPNPKYLGKIEILEVKDSIAVGRLLDGARFGALEKGDLVASKVIAKASSAGDRQALVDWPDWAGKTVKFEVRDKPWGQVFEWLSDQAGLPVIMSSDSKPTGTFTYIPKNSPGEYTIPQVIDTLNQSLDRQNYLLIRRGENLFVVSTVIANPLGIGGFRLHEKWTDRLFEEKSWDFGPVRRGEKVMHRFRLTNTLKQPIHISSLRLSAGFLQAAVRIRMDDSGGEEMATTHAWLAPHQSADIWVQVDTGRFAGTKTSSVYVQFDQPAPADVLLQVRGHSKEGTEPDNSPPGPRDPKMKINELEHQIHQLMMEIDDLRDLLKQQQAKPRAGS